MSKRPRRYSLDGWVPEAHVGVGNGKKKSVLKPGSSSGVGRGPAELTAHCPYAHCSRSSTLFIPIFTKEETKSSVRGNQG